MEKEKALTYTKRALKVTGKVLAVLLETVLLAAVALYCAMFVLAKGPSPTARDLFVLSVRETSAMGFLADLFFTEEEIAAIEKGDAAVEYEDTDTSIIVIPTDPPQAEDKPQTDAWGLTDEDGDGIILDTVRGEGYTGYMLVVLDPTRVVLATDPENYGIRGSRLADFVEKYDAVAGINAGGFDDPDGKGNGSQPDTVVVKQGQIYCGEFGVREGFAGIDDRGILHVGTPSVSKIRENRIQYGVGFGPVLISNGERVPTYVSGVNPRTGIGQRSDGAMLLLVIEGRQATSLGATYEDMAEVFLYYGAVNACNMDGGSSSMMWYQGDYVNKCASVIGIRPAPTAFLVLKEGTGE